MDTLSLTSTGCLVFAGYDDNGEETYSINLLKLKLNFPEHYEAYMGYVQDVIADNVLEGNIEWHPEIDEFGNTIDSYS